MRKAIKPQDLIENEDYGRQLADKNNSLREFAPWVGVTCFICGDIITQDNVKSIADKHIKKSKEAKSFDAIEIYKKHDNLQPVCAECIDEYLRMETAQEDDDMMQNGDCD